MAELYGASGAVVLASPLARRLYGKDVATVLEATRRSSHGFWPTWTLPRRSKQDARNRLDGALDAFALSMASLISQLSHARGPAIKTAREDPFAFHNVPGMSLGMSDTVLAQVIDELARFRREHGESQAAPP